MRSVLKFPIPGTSRAVIPMPKGAIVLTAHMQRDTCCLWADVPDRDAPPEERSFFVMPTGGACDPGWAYVATVFDGPYAWHVFEDRAEGGR